MPYQNEWPQVDGSPVCYWWSSNLFEAPLLPVTSAFGVGWMQGTLVYWTALDDLFPGVSGVSANRLEIERSALYEKCLESLTTWQTTKQWGDPVLEHARISELCSNLNDRPAYWVRHTQLNRWVPADCRSCQPMRQNFPVVCFWPLLGEDSSEPMNMWQDIVRTGFYSQASSVQGEFSQEIAQEVRYAYLQWVMDGIVYPIGVGAGREPESETDGHTCKHCSEHCEHTREVITGYRRHDTEEWCAECVESDAVTCDDCGAFVSDVETTSDDENTYCPQCMEERFRCDDCNSLYSTDSANSVDSGDRCVCDHCYQQYRTCANCDYVGLSDDMYYRDDWYCSDCDPGESDDEDSDLIHSYSHKPYPDFHGKGPRYFGVELEVEVMTDHCVDACARRVQDYFDDFAYLKSDGSLTRGFEIVTHPASLDYHRDIWRDFYRPQVCKGLKSFNTTTCGLHVHISRNAATDLTWSKFVSFISDPNHQKITEKIAMRSNSVWCAYYKKSVGSRHVLRNGTHSEAVNCANRNTVEVRIFKGTLRGLSVIRAIEYCDSVLSWCKEASHSSLTYDSYFCWLRKRRKDYLELWSFLDAKSLVAPATKPNLCATAPIMELEEVLTACV